MFIKMFPVLKTGTKTMLNCSRHIQLRNSHHEVNKLLTVCHMSATKPLLPQTWINKPRITACCCCSKFKRQSVKVGSSLSFNLTKGLNFAENSKNLIRAEMTHLYNFSNTTNFIMITRHLCTRSITETDDPHPLCDKNISLDLQPYRCYSTASKKVNDDIDSWEMLVDYGRLSPMELRIHERHREAVKHGKIMYIDPLTGYHVMTRLAHLERGECCGNACRHCPYGQSKVMEEKNKKTFNSAFYV